MDAVSDTAAKRSSKEMTTEVQKMGGVSYKYEQVKPTISYWQLIENRQMFDIATPLPAL